MFKNLNLGIRNHKIILQLSMTMISMMMFMRSVKLILDPKPIRNVSFHLHFEELNIIHV